MFGRLLILFITVPFLELVLLFRVGSRIGPGPTLAIIVLTGILGAALTRSQGLRALRRYQQALAEHRLPHAEVLDGLMILVAGAVLLTPGFLTDAVGFLLLVPSVRAAVRRRLGHALKARVQVIGSPGPRSPSDNPAQVRERVVDAKVIDPSSDDSST